MTPILQMCPASPISTNRFYYYLFITTILFYYYSTNYATCLFSSTNPSSHHHVSQRQRTHINHATHITTATVPAGAQQYSPMDTAGIQPEEDVSNKIELTLQSNAVNIDTDFDYYYYEGAMSIGLQRALDECRNKFKWDRWNCPRTMFEDILSPNSNVSVPNNKEAAFVRAIISSGVVLAVQQNCSKTMLTEQPTSHIERTSRDQAQRVECIRRGLSASRWFLDDIVPNGAEGRAVILQNYEAGRQAFSHTMKEHCKCHGVSGSCTTKTCWKQPANLSKIVDYLRKQYRLAAKVGPVSMQATLHPKALSQQLSLLDKNKLAFLEASPDYCYENKQLGMNGTLGRFCSMEKKDLNGNEVSKSERNSCERLCTDCGYKIHTTKTIVKKTCNCKFRFCCVVECVPCQKEEEVHQCVQYS